MSRERGEPPRRALGNIDTSSGLRDSPMCELMPVLGFFKAALVLTSGRFGDTQI